ncbi:MAG: cytochrome d ubiquinol oxidase subunit II [Deltaproteobacteria bacterium HGW-Deltaproteobacteria-14]|jgi:cytochrome d ubiquinol oxidase subunit II|nr:MAG: cytochrome d ubiquinol oxidase subunit II [Deltaproteobacteria bacterium HGW-Deltaproteobacteria-14]
MFESLSHAALQEYWWLIIAVLGGLLMMLTFVQGGQTLIYTLGKDERGRTLVVNALGRKWELTFTTLVTFGGALFAAFPLFYATSFGGAYWAWIAILLCFVVQAVAYEFRRKAGNTFGPKTYEVFLYINGSLGVILLGVAVGTLFTGAPFTVDDRHLSHWAGPARGLEAAAVPFNVLLGLTWLALARLLAALYFLRAVADDDVNARAARQVRLNAVIFLPLFAVVAVLLFTMDAAGYDPQTGAVVMLPHKHLDNLLALPLRALIPLALGVAGVVFGIARGWRGGRARGAFWAAAGGTALVGIALFGLTALNDTAMYPSTADLQSSLTLRNASASHYTLTVMSYVSLTVPFVLAYIAYAWRQMSRTPLSSEEIERDSASY